MEVSSPGWMTSNMAGPPLEPSGPAERLDPFLIVPHGEPLVLDDIVDVGALLHLGLSRLEFLGAHRHKFNPVAGLEEADARTEFRARLFGVPDWHRNARENLITAGRGNQIER